MYEDLLNILNGRKRVEDQQDPGYRLIDRLYNMLSEKEPDYDRVFDRIYNKIGEAERKKSGFSAIRLLPYAAGIAILAAISVNFGDDILSMFRNTKRSEIVNLVSQVPSRNRATLIINDSVSVGVYKDTVVYTQDKLDIGAVNKMISLSDDNDKAPQYHTLVIPKGGDFHVTLPDGTLVYLNSNTKLRFPDKFPRDKREVFLEGEAFFQVKNLGGVPFHVISGKSVTEVIGTEFNVKTGSLSDQITLCSGSVEIVNVLTSQRARLVPEEQATVSDAGIVVAIVDPYEAKAWTEGKFYFKNVTLGDITQKLNEWYNVDFIFRDSRLKSISFTGMVNRNEILLKTFDLFESSYDLKFRITGEGVVISGKAR